ncbi:MAG: MBL fold metallo-hydrolase [Clostridia bacterium]|nr:MBL fold metallo-hydrolase [Clostridia bacterium]
MRITALVENTTAVPGIGAEHGLSLYIETGDRKILFDMGQTDLFAQNAEKLGIDLSAVDIAVLSHGHYDHGGGLPRFLELNGHAPVYVSRHAFFPHYNGEKYIGLVPALQENPRLRPVGETASIAPGLTLHSCNERDKVCNTVYDHLTVEQEGVRMSDDFCHEQYLLIEEAGKRVLVSGCSHKGILNIAAWFSPDVLVGGFHFSKRPLDESLIADAKRLNDTSTVFYTGHCTGEAQFEFMKSHMERLFYLSTGKTITI